MKAAAAAGAGENSAEATTLNAIDSLLSVLESPGNTTGLPRSAAARAQLQRLSDRCGRLATPAHPMRPEEGGAGSFSSAEGIRKASTVAPVIGGGNAPPNGEPGGEGDDFGGDEDVDGRGGGFGDGARVGGEQILAGGGDSGAVAKKRGSILVRLSSVGEIDPSSKLKQCGGYSEHEWAEMNLHWLFRAFDVQSTFLIQPSDFHTGVMSMGLDSVNLTTTLMMFDEIDTDDSGFISEEEFIEYFEQFKSGADLQNKIYKLKSEVKMNVRAIDYGAESRQYVESDVYNVNDKSDKKDLADFLEAQQGVVSAWGSHYRWFDIKGYDYELMVELFSKLDFPDIFLKECGVKQVTRAEVIERNGETFFFINSHSLKLSKIPVAYKGKKVELKTKKKMNSAPPMCLSQQYSMILSRQRKILITVRKDPARSCGDGWVSLRGARQMLKGAGEELRQNQRFLCYYILHDVIESNLTMQDKLKNWLKHIERNIHRQINPRQISHIHFFGKCIANYQDQMVSIAEVIRPEDFFHTQAGAFLFNGGLQVPLKELSTKLETSSAELKQLLLQSTALQNLYHTLQNDRMNHVLYTLTLVTVAVVPAQLMTGIYGMNFTHMPELDYEYAYAIWWGILLTFIFLVLFGFRQMGLLAM